MSTTITYRPTDEQVALHASLVDFLRDKAGPGAVRAAIASDAGYDRALWTRMTEQLELPALAVPEVFGGAGYSYAELCLVAEALGAALTPSPFFATAVLATNALLCAGDPSAQRDLLPGLCSGTTATLAVTRTRDLRRIAPRVTGRRTGGTWQLTGDIAFVVDGATADLVLIAAETGSGVSLFAIDGGAPGVVRAPMRTFDLTRRQARLRLTDVPARLIGTDGDAAPGLIRALDLAGIALAAEQVGGAQHCLDASVDYAKTRIQFGQPIGAFQAIKHRCADMYLAIQTARTAATHAAQTAANAPDGVALVAPLTQALCSESFTYVATENIHVHGGIGYTWEHEAHLYFRRAKADHVLLGAPAAHRELLLARLGV